MFEIFANAWKTKELRKRMMFMLLVVFIFRLGNHITVPYVDPKDLADLTNQGNLLGLYNLISGGALGRFSLFALGVIPYINASIIMQLLTVALPPLENLQKEGEDGRKKIQNWTRYAALVISALMAYGTYLLVASTGAVSDRSLPAVALIVLTLVAGTFFLMWLGDQITSYGIGNGISVLIFINIISRLPQSLQSMALNASVNPMNAILVSLLMIALFIGVIYFSLGERRIPVQYAGRMVNGRAMKGQTQHLPIGVASSAVLGIIFAMSMMEFPATLYQLFPGNKVLETMTISPAWFNPFNRQTWMYIVAYFALVVFFVVFYTQITMKPDDMAENMQKSGGYVNGVKPGKSTEVYLEGVFNRVATYAGVFAAVIAVFPLLVGKLDSSYSQMNFSGTVLFILIGVALDTIRQLESQLMTRHYKGFLK